MTGERQIRPHCHPARPLRAYITADGHVRLRCDECSRAVLPPIERAAVETAPEAREAVG